MKINQKACQFVPQKVNLSGANVMYDISTGEKKGNFLLAYHSL